MKMLVLLEVEVSKTMAETMQRTGFTLAPDGTNLQVKVANSPAVPQRKTKVVFVTNPTRTAGDLAAVCSSPDAASPTPPAAVPPTPESK